MQTVTDPATARDAEQAPVWVVELNFAGYRILRWARRRRHLLGLGPRALAPREADLAL